MGLDITAYSRVEFIEKMEVEDWENKYYFSDDQEKKNTTIASHWESAYADRAAPIVDGGVYRVNGETFAFRAGSYSGYNEWRDWLSRTVLGVSARYLWEHEQEYQGMPFYELINFSDAEGIIGAPVARKLAVDFAQCQIRAEKAGQDENGWYARKYADWRKAFELASDNGFVEFH